MRWASVYDGGQGGFMTNGSISECAGKIRRARTPSSAGVRLLVFFAVAAIGPATAGVAWGQSFTSVSGPSAARIGSTVTLDAAVTGLSTNLPRVVWTVAAGSASFSGMSTITTPVPRSGRVSVELQVGPSPGLIEITAQLFTGDACEGDGDCPP